MSSNSVNNTAKTPPSKPIDKQQPITQTEANQSVTVMLDVSKRIPEYSSVEVPDVPIKDRSITASSKQDIIKELDNINKSNVDEVGRKVSDAIKKGSTAELFVLFNKINSLDPKDKAIQELKDIALNHVPVRWSQLLIDADELTSSVKLAYRQINKEVSFFKQKKFNVDTTGVHKEIEQSFIKMLDEQKHVDKTLKPEKNSVIISEKTNNKVYEITAYFHNNVSSLLDKTAVNNHQQKTKNEISSLLELYEANVAYADGSIAECETKIDTAVTLSEVASEKHSACLQSLDTLLKYTSDRKKILDDITSAKKDKTNKGSIMSFLTKLSNLFKKSPVAPKIITDENKIISGIDYFNQNNELNVGYTTQLADELIAVDESFKATPRYNSLKDDTTEYKTPLEFLQNNDNTLNNYHLYREASRVHKNLGVTNRKNIRIAVDHISKFIKKHQVSIQDTKGKSSIIFESAFKKTMDKLFPEANSTYEKTNTSKIISEYSKQLSNIVSSLGEVSDQLGIDINAINATELKSEVIDTIKDEDIQWNYSTEIQSTSSDISNELNNATTEDIAKINSDSAKEASSLRTDILDLLNNKPEINTQDETNMQGLFSRALNFASNIFMKKKP
jgi:hypothetical protein